MMERKIQGLGQGDREAFLFPDQVKMKIAEFIIFPFVCERLLSGQFFLGKGFCTLLCHGGMLLLKRLKTK